ncbi:hypothetical protein ACVSUJ_08425 [Yersinia enterocolitica]
MKQNPFSFYDFLGYMIPGAVLIYSIYFGFPNIKNMFINSFNLGLGVNSELYIYIPAVILSYMLGHLLAIASSIFVEGFSLYYNGYPSAFLFNVKKKFSFFVEDANDVDNKTCKLSKEKIIVMLVMLPVAIINLFFRKFKTQAKELPESLRNVAFSRCRHVLKYKLKANVSNLDMSKGIDGDYFRLIYHYAFENSERHANKLQNYVALYGFSRNISFVFVAIFWVSIIQKFMFKYETSYYYLTFSAILAYVFYIGFVKFYRRYTLEAVMAVCVIKN